jgi:hypothetical protein
MLQLEVRNAFAGVAKILIPNDASLTILKGKNFLSYVMNFYYDPIILTWSMRFLMISVGMFNS